MKRTLFFTLFCFTFSAQAKTSFSEQIVNHLKDTGSIIADKPFTNVFTLNSEFEKCCEKKDKNCLLSLKSKAEQTCKNDVNVISTIVLADVPVFIASGILRDAGCTNTAQGLNVGIGSVTFLPFIAAIFDCITVMMLKNKINYELNKNCYKN